ncbi:hypothetical protein EMM73_07815 [Rheinheimera sediminis]|uniref:hypothetical protein n=1 Tax=Rheinheimera sp. YQF-1 TaxID=2499626 RepID=UPI000FD707FD|nr:hypothetical protein [Rheinheimera sp. YQF-1]RVT46769.1 hypothetical protein EMM73_07815 [Rheinheimera sp. YQF-1]
MDLDTHLTMEFETTTPVPNLMKILGYCFGADDIHLISSEQVEGPYYGVLTDSVMRIFDRNYNTFRFDPNHLKEEIRYAYQQDEQFWWEMTGLSEADQEDFEFGNQAAAIIVWQEQYCSGALSMDLEPEEYHPEMQKLLIYKYIWLPLFPEETLPGYQPPASGYLPHFDRLLAESNSGKHDWIRRIKK